MMILANEDSYSDVDFIVIMILLQIQPWVSPFGHRGCWLDCVDKFAAHAHLPDLEEIL